jgi:hypothetical protein
MSCLKCLAATVANGSTISIVIGGFGTAFGSWDQKSGIDPLVCTNEV